MNAISNKIPIKFVFLQLQILKKNIWDSGKISSDESILQEYNGPALSVATRYYWQVKIWDNKGRETPWSESAFFETGLMNSVEWKAKWIDPEKEIDASKMQPASLLRKEFNINKKIASARLYVTSRGANEMYLNGQRVSDYYFTPGWTSYDNWIQYFTFDVTGLLKNGKNVIGAQLGDGWYRGFLAWGNNRNVWGKRLALLSQLVITFSDNSKQIVLSDCTWKATNNGPIRQSDIYQGETFDARMIQKNWASAGFDEKDWWPVKEASYPLSNIVSPTIVPTRKIEEIKAIKIITTPKGETVFDLGQNITGWVKLKVKGDAGDQILLNHAEVLDKAGNFYTANLRKAKCEINYTLRGGDEEVYEPTFTFMGFRYVKVTGMKNPTLDAITGVVIHSDMAKTGQFECSNPLINQLQHNIQWGQKGNFLDVPTDCPQRDERLGWTGDAQAFCRTAAYNMNVAPFFTKWLRDVAFDQKQSGSIPDVIPDVLTKNNKIGGIPTTSAGWGDVVTIAPWTMYQIYGEKRLLEKMYPNMKAHVEFMRKSAGDSLIWKGGSKYGDWLFYKSMIQQERDGHTPLDLIATAFFAYSTGILAKSAKVLNKNEDFEYYSDLFKRIKKVFVDEYITSSGRIAAESQTAYVLALEFDLMPENLRKNAAKYLVTDIKFRKNHLSTGFLGTPYLCHVLTKNGYTDVGYDLLLQESFPSWLYPVKMGATTIWERWDGIRPDSTFQDEGMNSFNHYAYGAIGDWMYRVVAGIELGNKIGYKHMLLQPNPHSRLRFAKANLNSNYGEIQSGWERQGSTMKVNVKIPANTTATLKLPINDPSVVKESGNSISEFKPQVIDNQLFMELGSGNYFIEYPINKNN